MISFHTTMVKNSLTIFIGIVCGIIFIVAGLIARFERQYQSKIYPGIVTESISLGGKTPQQVDLLFTEKNEPLASTSITIRHDDFAATVSAEQLDMKFDSALISKQSYSIGRSGNLMTDAQFHARSLLYDTFGSEIIPPIVSLPAPLIYQEDVIDEKLAYAQSYLDLEPVETLFEFDESTDRVTAFRLGKAGRKSDISTVKQDIISEITTNPGGLLVFEIPVETVYPKTQAQDSEDLGIVELVAEGESYFTGSIASRIYNIELAASRVNGILVAPGETFSFNEAIGDITAATGYKSAYVIKNGQTILDDGGGVCQVSTTIFRAALNAGLELVERRPHSYRVSYYEKGGFGPGLDATIYPPYVDLKIRNNMDTHILITSDYDGKNQKLTYRIYGKQDGRTVTQSPMRKWDYADPPPPSYQEDPTLPNGTIKQIEHATPGLKTAFDYKVERNGEILSDKTIASTFTPWQAVYLYGPGTPIPNQ